MRNLPYKRVFFFLLAMVLPSIVIALLGWRNAAQEREIETNRLKTERGIIESDARRQIAREILNLLDLIKSSEFAAAQSTAPSPTSTDNAVELVAWAEGGRLTLPWDVNVGRQQFLRSTLDKDFGLRAKLAETSELADKDYSSAESRYRELIASAEMSGDQHQENYARYRLARTLGASHRDKEALAEYRHLLNLPSNLVDEFGIPFTAWSAISLSKTHRVDREVLSRMMLELKSLTSITPAWNLILRELFEEMTKSRDGSVVADAKLAISRLSIRDSYLNTAQALQTDFPTLRVTSSNWQPYGKDGWLVGMTGPNSEGKSLVIAVRIEDIFSKVEASSESKLRFDLLTDAGTGESLSQNLPGLRVAFRSGESALVRTAGSHQTSGYILALPFVVGVTLFGGYLLWRDTRRESRMAEMRSQFVSSVSHELKTPLTSIRMFAETLQMNDTTPPQTRAEYLQTIVNETERLTRLLNNVLDFSSIERNQRSYNPRLASLDDILESAVRTMHFPLSQQGFNLQVNIQKGMPPANVDPDAFEQAILNLLSNAMKYSGKSRDIGLEACSQNGHALIRVIDHGIGIPAREQKRIFERFYRSVTSENRAVSGTGLGLSLVAHIVQSHAGSIGVESEPGRGSTFTIHVPLNEGQSK